MIIFSIDGLPQHSKHYLAMDYNSKTIYTALCDPLFKYNNESKSYECNACENYKIKNYFKTYIITLRTDLFYNDGRKVMVNEYKKSIEKFLKRNKKLNIYFKNIKEIFCRGNIIVFNLIKPDRFFIDKLSLYQLSPRNCGPFSINSINNYEINLTSNNYYRKNLISNLKYIVELNENKQINAFENNIIDITNNTLYPIDYLHKSGKYNEEESMIIYNIELSTKLPINIRKNIIASINKKNIIKILNNKAIDIDVFSLLNIKLKKIKTKNVRYDKKITIGYNSFYPNKLVAESLNNDLKLKNYKTELKEYSFNNYDADNCDINIVLNYFEFYNPLYFYESKYFQTVMKTDKSYSFILNLYKKIGSNILLKQIYKKFRKKYIKEALVTTKSRYLTNLKTKEFSFLSLNYDIFELKGDKTL